MPWLKRPQDQLLSSTRPKSPVVLRDSDEVAESPEFKKKFVRKMSKLASDMEFARQNSLYKQRKCINIVYSYFAIIILIK